VTMYKEYFSSMGWVGLGQEYLNIGALGWVMKTGPMAMSVLPYQQYYTARPHN